MDPDIDYEAFRRIKKYFIRVGGKLIIYPGQDESITFAEKTTQRLCRLFFGAYPRQFIPGVVPVLDLNGGPWIAKQSALLRPGLITIPSLLGIFDTPLCQMKCFSRPSSTAPAMKMEWRL